MKVDSKQVSISDYITSSRAAQLSGYSQDYVGQLCRSSSIECKRVSGEWHVDLSALLTYKKRFSPERDIAIQKDTTNLKSETGNGHQQVITDAEGTYISSGDAAKRTGYSQDYIGQLARSGAVTAKKIGRKWFIEQDALEQHKSHNDNLLAAVQANSAGVTSIDHSDIPIKTKIVSVVKSQAIPIVTYKHDDGSLVPGSATPLSVATNLETHIPEVRSMPLQASKGQVERKDLRSRPIQPNGMPQYKAENRLQVPELEPVFIEESVSTSASLFSIVAVSIISILSLLIIVGSLLLPEALHKHSVQVLDSVGITIASGGLEGTVLGKKTLHLTSAIITYKKDN